MRKFLAVFVFLTMLAASGISDAETFRRPDIAGMERAESIGHGFWKVIVAEHVTGGFESIGHFGYCYYQQQNLGQCDRISPSPSGRYAVFQDGPTGLVMFFDAETGLSTSITSKFPGLLGDVSWHEQASQVKFLAGESGSLHSITFNYGKRPD